MNKRTYAESAPRILTIATLERSLRNCFPIMDAARAAGCRVDSACLITDFEDEIKEHSDRVYNVPFRRSPINPINLITLIMLVRIMRSQRYDIVHTHTPAGGMIGRLAATIAGVPVRIYMAHGFHFHPEGSAIGNFIFSSLEKFAAHRLSDWVQVINAEDYRSALQLNVVPEEKLVMIDGTGIATSSFDPGRFTAEDRSALRRELNLTDSTRIIGVIGELSKRKRVDDIIESLALIKQKYPDIAVIVLGYGSEQPALEALAESRGVLKNVKFLGFLRDIPRYVAIMDVFAFATQQEGLPAALMEAMCMGIPSVATDIRGNRDIIVDGENGVMVPLGDTAAMAAALERIFNDKEFALNIGAVGRQLIVDKYDIKRTVEQQMATYNRAVMNAQRNGRLRSNLKPIVRNNQVGDNRTATDS